MGKTARSPPKSLRKKKYRTFALTASGMDCFLPSESEAKFKPFTNTVNMKDVLECDIKDPTESGAFRFDVYDVHVKVEPMEPELLPHFIVDAEVQNLTEGPIKKELVLVDAELDYAIDTHTSHTVPSHGEEHMEVCITKELCSSPNLDELDVVDNSDNIHKCGICQKTFNNNSSLTIHMFIHGKDTYTSMSSLTSNQEAEIITCKTCGLQFTSLTIYLKHRQTHLFEKPFKCEICEKDFNAKFLLTNHERVHTGEKPFPCDLCDKTFTEKVNLNRHKRSHLGTKPYRCDVCLNSFSLKHNLASHILSSHTNEKLWPFECQFCKKRWSNKKDLYRHLRTHTGEKPFTCEICKKSFCRKAYLACHIQSHNSERPYVCEICDKRFVCKSDCKKHFKIHMNKQNK